MMQEKSLFMMILALMTFYRRLSFGYMFEAGDLHHCRVVDFPDNTLDLILDHFRSSKSRI